MKVNHLVRGGKEKEAANAGAHVFFYCVSASSREEKPSYQAQSQEKSRHAQTVIPLAQSRPVYGHHKDLFSRHAHFFRLICHLSRGCAQKVVLSCFGAWRWRGGSIAVTILPLIDASEYAALPVNTDRLKEMPSC